jgi:hypothetical protein
MRLLYASVALTFSASVFADYQTVNYDIGNISTFITTLDKDTKAVTSGVTGLPAALQVEVDAVALDQRILAGLSDAQTSDAFGSFGSLIIGVSLINLAPKIAQTLQDVAAQNETFGELGVIVLSSLYQLKQDTDAFSAAVVAKLDALEAALAPGIVSSIDAAFETAIAAYK